MPSLPMSTTPPVAKNRSDHPLLAVPNAVPSFVAGQVLVAEKETTPSSAIAIASGSDADPMLPASAIIKLPPKVAVPAELSVIRVAASPSAAR